MIKLEIDNITEENKKEKYHKAITELSKALDIPVTIEHKEHNKEEFPYKCQEDFYNQIERERGLLNDELYSMVCVTLGLPLHSAHTKKSIDPNARKLIKNISWPEGGMISERDLRNLVEAIDKFLNRNTKGTAKEIVLKEANIARIIDQLRKKKKPEEIRKMSYDQVVDQKKMLKLNDIFSKDYAERLGLYERIIADKITNINEDTRNQIRDTINSGLITNQPKSIISQNLFDKFGDLNKDWQKVIDTETVNVFNESFVQTQVKDRKPGEKVYFKRIEINDKVTCKFCKKATDEDVIALYVDEPRDDDKIDDEVASIAIWSGKSNMGRAQADWWWAMGVIHSFCRGFWERYIPGMDFNFDLPEIKKSKDCPDKFIKKNEEDNMEIRKAKYLKRWRGKDNKWHYQYKITEPKGRREELKQLLAPNGEPSNLNSKQWHQVRTKEFKNWFGDWENDPENASKVVDDNGEPLVVYHGTMTNINEFKASKKEGTHGEKDQFEGIYFTDSFDGASFYSLKEDDDRYMKKVFLSINKPYLSDGPKSLKEEIGSNSDSESSKKINKKGYDGIILKKGFYSNGGPYKLYLAFNSNQIKSATINDGSFDQDNPDIRKSKFLKKWMHGGQWRYAYRIPQNLNKYERSDIKPERQITISNYTKETEAVFREVPIPERNPDYVSQSGTQYWIDNEGITRYSDHWGAVIGTTARCNWFIGDQNKYEQSWNYKDGYKCGRSEWKDFKDLAFKRDSNINIESKKRQYKENKEKVEKVLQGNKIFGITKEEAQKANEAMKKHGPVFVKDNHLYGVETDGKITKLFPVRRKK